MFLLTSSQAANTRSTTHSRYDDVHHTIMHIFINEHVGILIIDIVLIRKSM